MSRFKVFIFLYICILLFCSVTPFENPIVIVLPEYETLKLYQIIFPERIREEEPLPPRRDVPEQYRVLFDSAATAYGLPYAILENLAYVESDFTADAESPVREDEYRDLGMFQFNERYLEWYTNQYNVGRMFDPFDPAEAIRIAALHMFFLRERYGNWFDVFLAYNAGIDRVDRDDIPASAELYLSKVYRSDT